MKNTIDQVQHELQNTLNDLHTGMMFRVQENEHTENWIDKYMTGHLLNTENGSWVIIDDMTANFSKMYFQISPRVYDAKEIIKRLKK